MARLTVDDLEKDIERPEPFEFVARSGKVFTFPHPKGLHYSVWSNLHERRGIAEHLKAVLGDQYDEFVALPEVDGFLMEKILDAYEDHYGIGSRGESRGSSESSTGTVTR
jgi:hypothetical protein